MVHGWVYVAYLVTVFLLWTKMRWGLGRLAAMVLAGVIPFMSFVLERRVHRDAGATELAEPSARDRAAEGSRHRLEAVADPEHRHPRDEQRRVHRWRTIGVHAGRPTGQDDRGRVLRQHPLDGPRVRHDLGVDPRLTDAARDQLGVLRAEVDDEDRARGGRHGARVVRDTGSPSSATASRWTRRSSTNDMNGMTPASTMAASLPRPQRILVHSKKTVTRYATYTHPCTMATQTPSTGRWPPLTSTTYLRTSSRVRRSSQPPVT